MFCGEKMKKIGVYLGNEPYWGGAFQYNQSILEALDSLDKHNYRVVAFYFHPLWKDYLRKYDFVSKQLVHCKWKNIFSAVVKKILIRCRMRFWKYRWLLSRIDFYSRYIDSCGLDLVLFPSQECYAAFQKTPAISVIHDLMHRYEVFPEVKDEYYAREQLYDSICNASVGIFVDSHVGKCQVIECYGKVHDSKVYVLPFTAPQYLYYECEKKPKQFLPEKYVFYPAQFWQHKNHINLIKAISLLKDNGISVNLVLVGSQKNGYEKACNLIKELNLTSQVFILGYVSDGEIKFLYKHARAMVMPTFFGPTNIPPLEAMVMGCPMAISAVYGMPDMVGDAGLLFNPHSVEDIAECVKRLWLDDKLCENLITKGFKRSKRYSQEIFNKNFAQHIGNILGKL